MVPGVAVRWHHTVRWPELLLPHPCKSWAAEGRTESPMSQPESLQSCCSRDGQMLGRVSLSAFWLVNQQKCLCFYAHQYSFQP